jgi:hypothetical protein
VSLQGCCHIPWTSVDSLGSRRSPRIRRVDAGHTHLPPIARYRMSRQVDRAGARSCRVQDV